jgi:serine/threonine protein kinase
MELTEAQATPTSEIYLKRPHLELYGVTKEHGVTNAEQQLSQQFLAEAEVMTALSKHPHPNIVRYYGCRVVRGHITGLVMDRHSHDLYRYPKEAVGKIEKEPLMAALESAIQHLHALPWAHNDLTPYNILVNRDGMPVLIDFGGCQLVGTHLKYIQGTKEWIDGKTADYCTSGLKCET